MISRGAKGGIAPLVKISVHLEGAEPHQKLLYRLCISKGTDIASKVFSVTMIIYVLLHGY